jgi:hypothetical protein
MTIAAIRRSTASAETKPLRRSSRWARRCLTLSWTLRPFQKDRQKAARKEIIRAIDLESAMAASIFFAMCSSNGFWSETNASICSRGEPFLGSTIGAVVFGGIIELASGKGVGDTSVVTALEAIPGVIIGLAVVWRLACARSRPQPSSRLAQYRAALLSFSADTLRGGACAAATRTIATNKFV